MIVGAKVEQRIQDDDGMKVVDSGVVMACERSGAPAQYTALVAREDGSMFELPATLLTVVGRGKPPATK